MKRGLKAGWILGTTAFLSMGCGSYGSADKETAPSAQVTTSASEVMVGSSIELNAAGSVYDSLLWSINQTTISACDDHELCILTMDTAGTFEIALDATTSATQRATVTIQVVDNPSAKKAAAAGAAGAGAAAAAAAGGSSTPVPATASFITSPSQISGSSVVLWLDANDLSSLYVDNGCTATPVTAQGNSVGCWKDKSGNNYHATQATSGAKPAYQVSSTNGKPAIRMDNVDDGMNVSASLVLAKPFTIFLVARYTTASGSNRGRILQSKDTNWLFGTWSNSFGFYAGNWVSNPIALADDWFIAAGGLNNVAPYGSFYRQGANYTDSDTPSTDPGKLSLGGVGASAEYAPADVAEVIIFNSKLSDANRQKVELYLAAKWNIPLYTLTLGTTTASTQTIKFPALSAGYAYDMYSSATNSLSTLSGILAGNFEGSILSDNGTDVTATMSSGSLRYINGVVTDSAAKRAYFQPLVNRPTSCAEVKASTGNTTDGDYTIYAKSDPTKSFTIYCYNLNTSSPEEYLPLVNTGGNYNYGLWKAGGNNPGTDVKTSFTKARFNPTTMSLNPSVRTFATTTGSLSNGGGTSELLGQAEACIGSSNAAGTANVNLVGTIFAINSSWGYNGFMPAGTATKSSNDQIISVTGGGYCGNNTAQNGTILLKFYP